MGGYGRTSYATEQYNTSQKSERNPNVTPWLVVVHHAATTGFRAVVQMELGAKQVSSTIVLKDDNVASMFDEYYRAWSLSSGYYDSVSLSSETCNSGGASEGWPISETSYHTLAKVIAEWCNKYNIPINRERIIGHREVYTRYDASYATACPGGINLDYLVNLVRYYANGGPASSNDPVIIKRRRKGDSDMSVYYRHAPSGAIGLFKGYEVVLFNADDYKKHREVILASNAHYEKAGLTGLLQPTPPDYNNADAFTNLDQRGWDVEVAVHGGYRS